MGLKNKFIKSLYEIVIYVFPFLLLFFVLVSFQLWKLEDTKAEMTNQLRNSTEIIEAAKLEIQAMRKGLISANDSFAYYSINSMDESDIQSSFPDESASLELVELGINVLNRVSELKNDSVNYFLQDYVLTKPTGNYYAIVISYSELGYAIIQREHLMSLGFNNIKILEIDKLYSLSIAESDRKNDIRLYRALDKWNFNFKTQSDAFIKQH